MRWLRHLFHKSAEENQIDKELRFHLEQQIKDYVASGRSPQEAARRAKLDFGGLDRVKEEVRDTRKASLLEDCVQDVVYGLRLLRKNPGFTTVAILTLALGIGANTAMFSVVEGVVLAPLHYYQPDRLVMVLESNQLFPQDAISYPNFLDWQRNARSFQQMAAVMLRQGFDLTGPGTPEHLDGDELSSGFFSTLGVDLALGREFSPQEDRRGGAPVVIVSNRLWTNRFAGSLQALGKSITLGGVDRTIVGVLPPGFLFISNADVYVPLAQHNPLTLDARGNHDNMVAIARLKPAVSISQAESDLTAIQNHLDELYPDADRGLGVDTESLKQIIVGDVSGILFLLLGAVGLVLLIACANLANLLLARSSARSREFAIRSALGAGRARIVRQLITESVLLSLAGGGLGLGAAAWGLKVILVAMPGSLPRTDNVGVDAHVLFFAFCVSIMVGILFGLAPALRTSSRQLQYTLKEGGRTSTGTDHRVQGILVIAQMALTLVLLVGAGLLLRTLRQLSESNPGFDTQHLITFKVGLSPSATKTGSSIRAGFLQLLDRVRAIPGVRAADFTMLVPLTRDDSETPFWIGSQKPAALQNAPRTLLFNTGTDYLRTMGIPLLRGRFFTIGDNTKSPCVAVIDSVFAQEYFPGEDPIGQAMTFGWEPTPWGPCPIVGVVGHVSHWGLGEASTSTRAQSYYPLFQAADQLWPLGYPDMKIIVRTRLDVAAVMPAIRTAVYGGSSDQTIYDVHTMQEIASESMSSQKYPMILLGAFAGLALLLASIGIYGVVSYSVSRRVNEFGIRVALGAEKRDIFRLVLSRGLRLTLLGLAIGAVVALILTRLLASFSHLLYGVRASDPLTFIAVSAVLTLVAFLACYIPARRATRVDPINALRHE
jgi:predicted permease